jgi:hypothetical protein
MQLLLVMYIIFGLFLLGISFPLLYDKIPPNGLYGFRVKQTMEHPEIWYPVNRHFARRLIIISLAMICAAVLFYFVPDITIDQYALSCLAVFAVFFGVGLAQSVRYMNNLVKEGN